ncbi:MAG: metalloregulator ArsR/SmtB family transcription factor [Gemmatimonadaceae bacterium]
MTSDQLDATFAALADPTRRAILARLASGDASVSELAEPFRMSQPAISRHLKVLESAGLISGAKDAQRRPRKLEAKPLGEAHRWLEEYRKFWEFSYKRLDVLLDQLMQDPSKYIAPQTASDENVTAEKSTSAKTTAALTNKPKRKRN